MFCFILSTGSSSGAHRSLPDGQGQPGGPASSVHLPWPQARVGALQRVCADHQELHPYSVGRQARVVSYFHLLTSTLHAVPARIMTCQCFLSSAISVVIWSLAISSFTRSCQLSFRLPSVVSFSWRLHMSEPSQPLLSEEFCHRVHVCLFPDVYISHMV